MTIEEINALTVEDVQVELKVRILQEMGETNFDIEEWEFDPADLEAELEEYKAELIAEAMRIQDLKDRIDAMDEPRHAHAILRPEVPNAALFFKKMIIENSNHVEAEALLAELEAKDAELKAAKDASAYIALRKSEYPSIEELVVALFEEDQAAIDALKAQRAAVKLKYPKGV